MDRVAVLTWLSVASAALAVRAEQSGNRPQVYLFKPLTTLLILGLALSADDLHPARPAVAAGLAFGLYRIAVCAGLVCSLAGDVFLMLPADRFLAGLLSFLLAHLCYTAAFICRSGAGFSAWSAAPFLLYCVCLLQLLWPAVGSLRWAVAGYGFVISGMAWAAFEAWRGTARRAALLAFAGAVLFVLSDSALAYDRFVARFEAAPTVILLAYFAAQLLIALSIGR